MALHVVADDRSVEDVHGREQGGRPVPLAIMGHGSGAAPLHRQARLGAVERLDLALLVDGKHDGVRRGIDIEPDDVAQLVDELGIRGELELPDPVRLNPWARQTRLTELTLTPAASAIAAPVQCVVRSLWVRSRGRQISIG